MVFLLLYIIFSLFEPSCLSVPGVINLLWYIYNYQNPTHPGNLNLMIFGSLQQPCSFRYLPADQRTFLFAAFLNHRGFFTLFFFTYQQSSKIFQLGFLSILFLRSWVSPYVKYGNACCEQVLELSRGRLLHE